MITLLETLKPATEGQILPPSTVIKPSVTSLHITEVSTFPSVTRTTCPAISGYTGITSCIAGCDDPSRCLPFPQVPLCSPALQLTCQVLDLMVITTDDHTARYPSSPPYSACPCTHPYPNHLVAPMHTHGTLTQLPTLVPL